MTIHSIAAQRRGARAAFVALCAAASMFLAGCASESGGGYTAVGAGEAQLEEAQAFYRQGDYAATIKRLQSAPDIWSDTLDVRMRAHKLLAFSYCVSNRRAMCRQQFERMLELSPGYELPPAEAGHPIWGVEFREAKKSLPGKR